MASFCRSVIPAKAGIPGGEIRLWSSPAGPPAFAGATASPDLLPRLRPVGGEALQALVGERVPEELADDGRGRRHDVGADHRRLEDVDRVADAGDQDLGLEIVIVVDGPDLGDDLHPVEAGVVVATDEGRDEG